MVAKDKQKDRRETDKGGKRQDRGERERGPILPSLPPVFPSLRQFPSVNSIIYRYTPRRFLLFPPLPRTTRVRRLFNLIGVLPRLLPYPALVLPRAHRHAAFPNLPRTRARAREKDRGRSITGREG